METLIKGEEEGKTKARVTAQTTTREFRKKEAEDGFRPYLLNQLKRAILMRLAISSSPSGLHQQSIGWVVREAIMRKNSFGVHHTAMHLIPLFFPSSGLLSSSLRTFWVMTALEIEMLRGFIIMLGQARIPGPTLHHHFCIQRWLNGWCCWHGHIFHISLFQHPEAAAYRGHFSRIKN